MTYREGNIQVYTHIPLGKDTSGSIISFTKIMSQMIINIYCTYYDNAHYNNV